MDTFAADFHDLLRLGMGLVCLDAHLGTRKQWSISGYHILSMYAIPSCVGKGFKQQMVFVSGTSRAFSIAHGMGPGGHCPRVGQRGEPAWRLPINKSRCHCTEHILGHPSTSRRKPKSGVQKEGTCGPVRPANHPLSRMR